MPSVTTGSGSQTRKKEDGYSQVLQQPRTELAGKTPMLYRISSITTPAAQTTAETRVVDALNTLGLSFGKETRLNTRIVLSTLLGLTDTSEFVKEWGLTEPHTDQRWVNSK